MNPVTLINILARNFSDSWTCDSDFFALRAGATGVAQAGCRERSCAAGYLLRRDLCNALIR